MSERILKIMIENALQKLLLSIQFRFKRDYIEKLYFLGRRQEKRKKNKNFNFILLLLLNQYFTS